MDRLATRRVHMLARLAFLWAALIVGRLVQLQVVQHSEYRRLAQQQQQRVEEVRAARGSIFDRNGQRLAMSLPVESVCVDPLRIKDIPTESAIIAKILSLNPNDLREKMQAAVADRNQFLWVKRHVTPEEAKRLRELNQDWVEFRTETQRFYPGGTLAAHLLGGVDFEENGNAGIEQSMNEELAGHPGEILLTSDVQRRGFDSKTAMEAQPGQDIHLTIDSSTQFVAERELAKMVDLHHAKSGSVVAIDPRNGDVIAYANYPTYDPNQPPKSGDMAAREDLAVAAPFEPGSVFKVITLSSALETTRLRPESIIDCGGGSITLFGRTIHDHSRYGQLSMADVLARSSNIGAINVGRQVGDQKLYEYVRRFGFGKKTGVPLPGESSGMVRPVNHWQKTSLSSVAMGHEIGVTALQLAQAATVIASGGMLIRPRLIVGAQMPAPLRVLRPETAITMRGMMEGVVIKPYGTAHKYAHIDGYTSAGKTGTAQIYDYRAHQYTHLYNASFMGFAPVTNPAIVVVVTINGTTGLAGYGGPVSAPVFRDVAAAALRMKDVPKDLPEMSPANDDGQADENDVAIADLGSSIPPPLARGDNADAADDRPMASAKNVLDQRTFFAGGTQEAAPDWAGPRAPNFQGKTMRAVIEESAAMGIPVEFAGSGIARGQIPEPGAPLPLGHPVRIQFGR